MFCVTENRAPVFESEPAIRVVAGQRITVVFEAHNAEGIFEFRLETNIPAEQYSFGEYFTEFFSSQQLVLMLFHPEL